MPEVRLPATVDNKPEGISIHIIRYLQGNRAAIILLLILETKDLRILVDPQIPVATSGAEAHCAAFESFGHPFPCDPSHSNKEPGYGSKCGHNTGIADIESP